MSALRSNNSKARISNEQRTPIYIVFVVDEVLHKQRKRKEEQAHRRDLEIPSHHCITRDSNKLLRRKQQKPRRRR